MVSTGTDFTLPRIWERASMSPQIKIQESLALLLSARHYPAPLPTDIHQPWTLQALCKGLCFFEVHFCVPIQHPHLGYLSTFSRFLSRLGSLCWKLQSSAKEKLITLLLPPVQWQKFNPLAPPAVTTCLFLTSSAPLHHLCHLSSACS